MAEGPYVWRVYFRGHGDLVTSGGTAETADAALAALEAQLDTLTKLEPDQFLEGQVLGPDGSLVHTAWRHP